MRDGGDLFNLAPGELQWLEHPARNKKSAETWQPPLRFGFYPDTLEERVAERPVGFAGAVEIGDPLIPVRF